jgi:hypothetical protein
MTSTTVPAALTALVALAAAALPSVQVFDGPPTTDLPDTYLLVGFAEGGPAVTGQQITEGGGLTEEVYDIACQLSVYSGDTDIATTRGQAAGLFDTLATALAGADKLGGAVGFADLSGFDWTQDQASEGAVVTVDFTVNCSLNQRLT